MKRALFDTVTVLPFASGNVVDRIGYESAVLAVTVEASQTATIKVETADSTAGPYEPVKDSRIFVDNPVNEDGEAVIENEAEAQAVANLDIDLIGCKEYVNEYGRSVVTYADNLAEWVDAAWVGSVGPFWPESVTWKWKVPDNVSVADLRDSERDLLEENRVNFMTAEYKHEYMKNGICGDGNFIDNVLGADYITHQIRENLYEIFIANKKIAYTDDGFALVAAGVFAALNRAVELHIIATDPEDDTGVYTVVIPKRADATDEQARNRQMPDIKWSAQLEGAVHSVKVNGTLRVTLNG